MKLLHHFKASGRVLSGALLFLMLLSASVWAAPGNDPFPSLSWPELAREYLGNKAQWVFDDQVQVTVPEMAVDAMNVPVKVDASKLGQVKRVVVVVEHNPIRRVLAFEPGLARPVLSFRFKLEQSSQVRAAALDAQGLWHVGSGWVESSGGGCTLPGATRSDGSWSSHLGQVDARLGASADNESRLKVRIMHPMDTGLVSGIPAFHIEELILTDNEQRHYMKLELYEPVSENPVFSFDLPDLPRSRLLLTGHDNDGNRIEKIIEEPGR